MPRKLASHRSPWRKKELAEIRRSVKQGQSVAAISKKLGRSEAAIRNKAHLEGISTRAPKKRSAGARR